MTPYPLADAGSDFSLRVAEPFVETDAAEACLAGGHERVLLDPAAVVSGLGVAHDLRRVADLERGNLGAP